MKITTNLFYITVLVVITLLFVPKLRSQQGFNFEYSDYISVLDGGELLNHPWVGGLNNPQFSNIDLNGDNIQDLFVFDRATNQVFTFLHDGNIGSSDFIYAPEYEINFPQLNNWALLRDYNCDGFPDIFAHTPGGFKVYKNNGDNTFLLVSSLVNSVQYGNPPSNLYVSSADIPSITDIDNDGDLDVITFGIWGQSVQYHRNYSMENYGVCDSLKSYVLKNDCWGRFTESPLDNGVNLYDTLSYPCDGSTVNDPQLPPTNVVNRNSRHVGSTVLAINLNGSNVYDLILGDIDASNLVALFNNGTSPNTNSAMDSFDSSFPSNTTPLNLSVFPASFYVDVTGDDIRDLLVAPNLKSFESHDLNGVHFYINTNTDNDPNFVFQSNSFLQDEMLEVGTTAVPVLFDVNGDGLEDLIIARNFTSYPDPQNPITSLYFYQNTGTLNNPEFTFIDDDFANLSGEGLGKEIVPSFGDIDGDDDLDMVLGLIDGSLYWIENTGAVDAPAIFNTPLQVLEDADDNPISVLNSAFPQLIDLNLDGLTDLVIGKRDGTITYYEADSTDGEFVKITDTLGGVNVTEYWDVIGYSAPHFYNQNDTLYLFCGSKSGQVYSYDSISNNLNNDFRLIDSSSWSINNGFRSSAYIKELNGDGDLEMLLGNVKGGLRLYEATADSELSIDEQQINVPFNAAVFPNPFNSVIEVKSDANIICYKIYNLSGEVIKMGIQNANSIIIGFKNEQSGIYILELENKNHEIIRKKIIKI